MIRPRKLVDYPWVVVRLDCVLCTRRGRYRLARLAARYGPEQSLDGLLRDLAQDCPWYNERPRKYEPRCGARFVDLERNLPPTDHPDEPIYRQRGPDRESLPKRPRPPDMPSARLNLPPTLSGWPADEVGYRCRRCPRTERFGKAVMLATFGDLPLTQLRETMAKGCPRWGNTQIYELCGAMFILPWDRNGTLEE